MTWEGSNGREGRRIEERKWEENAGKENEVQLHGEMDGNGKGKSEKKIGNEKWKYRKKIERKYKKFGVMNIDEIKEEKRKEKVREECEEKMWIKQRRKG